MKGPIHVLLEADHRRLGTLLDRAVADPGRFDHEAFETFRAGIPRHIGIEEKILLPEARRRRGGQALAIAARLREDHGVLGALLVPTPDTALVAEIRRLLDEHDALEEAPGGLYDACDQLIGSDGATLERIAAAPAVPLAAHFDGRGTHRTVAAAREMLRRARRAR
jgi:hypothetical protein